MSTRDEFERRPLEPCRANESEWIDSIAVVGLSCRLPGASTPEQFWRNLRDGVESLTRFSEVQLREEGVPEALLRDPDFVSAAPTLDRIDEFDAEFFGFAPREAELQDPQLRILLELAWEALENAGYDPHAYAGSIGVWAGAALSQYYLSSVLPNPSVGADFQGLLGNVVDFYPTQVSYRLNLRGPSITVQTACSTSLVAVCEAAQSLLLHQCDMALAGGITLALPTRRGHLWREGGMYSRDGHTRSFDAAATGTVIGDGGGLVVLRRYEDARDAGDHVYALLRGWGVTNDGAARMFFTAPGTQGQVEAVGLAHAMANVGAESISYVEAHGSASELGDAMEIAGLSEAFESSSCVPGSIGIGSVKSNFGHLAQGAGVAGLMKTVLALEHRQIPPSLFFDSSRPDLGLDGSPFSVVTRLKSWNANGGPRRAGVNSLGMGGTNAHVVVEEGPASGPSDAGRPLQLLLVSGRSRVAAEQSLERLRGHLSAHPELSLADVAFTLSTGRRHFDERTALVCRDAGDAVTALESQDPQRLLRGRAPAKTRPVSFMFPGVGDHHPEMLREIYENEASFARDVDHCCEILEPILGVDLREVLYPDDATPPGAAGTHVDFRAMVRGARRTPRADRLDDTLVAQPAVFVVEYALARLWMEWGVMPDAMIGHSIGEYVAACLSGVFSLEDALAVVAERARLIDQLPGGAMTAVLGSPESVEPALSEGVSIAAVNAPGLCVVTGTPAAVEETEERLRENGCIHRRLATEHAFHCPAVEAIREPLRRLLARTDRKPPRIPFVSNVTGRWITAEQATDPDYWCDHASHCVQFGPGVMELMRSPQRILLEVGPGRSLCGFAAQASAAAGAEEPCLALASMANRHDWGGDLEHLLGTLGRLWLANAGMDWEGFYRHELRHRLPLPTYPFQRQRYWIPPSRSIWTGAESAPQASPFGRESFERWFSVPTWNATDEASADPERLIAAVHEGPILILMDDEGVGRHVAERLRSRGGRVIEVHPGAAYRCVGDDRFEIGVGSAGDYGALLEDLIERDAFPRRLLHLFGVQAASLHADRVEDGIASSFDSLLFLALAFADIGLRKPLDVLVFTAGSISVDGGVAPNPLPSLSQGLTSVWPLESPNVCCELTDLQPVGDAADAARAGDEVLSQVGGRRRDRTVAIRGGRVLTRGFAPLESVEGGESGLRQGGTYLITGGLGGVGLSVAEYLVETYGARVVLMGRRGLEAAGTPRAADPEEGGGDDAAARVARLSKQGATVRVVRCDVSNREELSRTVASLRGELGRIDGCFHAAGVPGEGLIGLKTREAARAVLTAKVEGTLALVDVLGSEPDFLALFSSVASIAPAPGQSDYCAANAFLDCFAAGRDGDQGGCRVVSLNWGLWRSLSWGFWSSGGGDDPAAGGDEFRQLMRELRDAVGIRPEEGMRAIEIALATQQPQIAVSPQPLDELIRRIAAAPGVAGAGTLDAGRIYPRPQLSTGFVAPRTDQEEVLAKIWCDVLRLEEVGVTDDFLDLGGHSLLAMQLLSRLERELDAEVPLRDFLAEPTIVALARSTVRGGGDPPEVSGAP